MATNANWTIVFEDKKIIKNHAEGADAGVGYLINDDAFWATTDFQNIWAIQSGTSNSSDEVEHRDDTPHCSLADEGIDIQQFVTRWDAVHLTHLQGEWDADNVEGESESDKIARLGPRPTSYSS
jgi:hypothetical protein|tara:strand:- start:3273 stop:3644 length:372 start_codon:yes stop_codon:yes gene_type:complete